MKENKPQISESNKWLMLGTAIFFDVISLVSLIPAIGWILGFLVWLFAFMTFWLWFMMNGQNIISFSNPKKLISTVLGSIIEATPFGFIPAWTFLILYLTRVEKMVDKVVKQVPGGSSVIGSVIKKS